ncbi:MAG: DNA repair protein RecN [Pseudomonadota bacterium]
MLLALCIRSFLLIDHLELDAEQGFTSLTGETGAGKSIILDALGIVLGGQANRKMVRKGADQAVISASFLIGRDHPVYDLLQEMDLSSGADEALTLRRTVSASGPSRAFINDQPVASATLVRIAESLVEIHSQHAASSLLRPSSHRSLLDSFSGLEDHVSSVRTAWEAFICARTKRETLEKDLSTAREKRDWLQFAVNDLEALAPEPDETKRLLEHRAALMQAEQLTAAICELDSSLSSRSVEETLTKAARAADRLVHINGLDVIDEGLAKTAHSAAETIERVLIELTEAQGLANALKVHDLHDPTALDRIEARLLALRAAARKFDLEPDTLSDALSKYKKVLDVCDAETADLEQLRSAEAEAQAFWREKAEDLSTKRRDGALQFEAAIMAELAALHLGKVKVRVRFDPLAETDSGATGLERAEFEVETNPGTGFGPLRQIASGGELARFSLALKCALAHAGVANTLIFDEADQGVGGAVAAAIGERLAHLGQNRQVFAITHSPQVASCAARQWRVRKSDTETGQTTTRVYQLDDGQRLEEIARMLSGSSITDEARAAASKLLEVA